MASLDATAAVGPIDEREYKRRIRAWTMYDWANSAFVTTVMAAVLPVYYSTVAGATLPSEAAATALWSMGLSISLFVTAIFSPILGTISDVMRGKKKFLAIFVGMGIVATGLLVMISTGDWLLASLLFIFGRIGFTAANVFYDALLPHVAREEDRDRVSTQGYAMGYVGGGLLLAINVVMIQYLPDIAGIEFAGVRLSLLSVALWWAVFSVPVFLRVPEPPGIERVLESGRNVVSSSFSQLRETFGDIQKYRELFKFLIAFLIYNDGIGTIIGVATIYGAELGFDTTSLILALLLVQFVGIPFSLVFGRIPSKTARYRPQFVAFVVFNMVALPLIGVAGRFVLPSSLTGAPPQPYVTTASAVGEGYYEASDPVFEYNGDWTEQTVGARDLVGTGFVRYVNGVFGEPPEDKVYFTTDAPDSQLVMSFNGQALVITHSVGPEHGMWHVLVDGEPVPGDDGIPVTIDATSDSVRYGETTTITVETPGQHELRLINDAGGVMAVEGIEVLRPARTNNLGTILGMILGLQILGAVFAILLGRPLFSGLAEHLDTKRSVMLALAVYAVIAVWGFFLDSIIEFWFLAWMVAIVQGGSQALSRSLYASMSPAAKSGEFFGLFGVMEKFSAILGPLLFTAAGILLGNTRWAILSLILFFFVGIVLLTRVDVQEGRRVAQVEDAAILGAS